MLPETEPCRSLNYSPTPAARSALSLLIYPLMNSPLRCATASTTQNFPSSVTPQIRTTSRASSVPRVHSEKILWIGSGGLAHALAAELPQSKPQPAPSTHPGHTIFFIGSPHLVTRVQVERLQSSSATDRLVHVVLGQTDAEDIRRDVAAHDPAQIGCLFMTGGDTAHFVCRTLGIHALLLQREFAPGVPLAIAEGGPFDGVSVVLKSGGFGEPDLLCRLLETCHPEVLA